MSKKRAIIIGAGVGGLTMGIKLLTEGYEVSIYEKNSLIGGALHSTSLKGTSFLVDEFSSIGIHPFMYKEPFISAGLNPNDYFCGKKLKELYRVFYWDNTMYSFPHSMNQLDSSFESFFKEDITTYKTLIKHLYRCYKTADDILLNKPLWAFSSVSNKKILTTLLKFNPLITTQQYICHHIKHQKLQDYLLFQSFYMGLAPTHLSYLYGTIPAVTQKEGLLFIDGGMNAYSMALAKAFTDLGGKLHNNSNVLRILTHHNVVKGVIVNNKIIQSDLVISDVDYLYTQTKLLRKKTFTKFPKYKMSCSVFVLHLALSKPLPMLSVHNIYLSKTTKDEFTRNKHGQLPLDPPAYIYCPTALASESTTLLNIMIRVPNLLQTKHTWSQSMTRTLRSQCLQILKKVTKDSSIESHIIGESISTPNTLKSQLNYTNGAAFGLSPSYLQSMFFRPQNKDKVIQNLYYVGMNIHPGNGTSIVIKGANGLMDTIKGTY